MKCEIYHTIHFFRARCSFIRYFLLQIFVIDICVIVNRKSFHSLYCTSSNDSKMYTKTRRFNRFEMLLLFQFHSCSLYSLSCRRRRRRRRRSSVIGICNYRSNCLIKYDLLPGCGIDDMQKMPSVFGGSGVSAVDLAKVFSTIFRPNVLVFPNSFQWERRANTRFAVRYTSIKTKTQHAHEMFNYF